MKASIVKEVESDRSEMLTLEEAGKRCKAVKELYRDSIAISTIDWYQA